MDPNQQPNSSSNPPPQPSSTPAQPAIEPPSLPPSTVIQVGSAEAAKIPTAGYQSSQARAQHSRRLFFKISAVILLMAAAVIGAIILLNKVNEPMTSQSKATSSGSSTGQNSPGANPGLLDPNAKAQDNERKADITALQTQAEVYFADNAVYPTLENFNDPAFRSANLKALADEYLIDPSNKTGKAEIRSKPTPGFYAYQVTPAGCDNQTIDCQHFTLTANLSDNTRFTRTDANN